MYSWKVQYSEFYSDQFSDKGPIDKVKAIDEFQQFPWDKEIVDYKRSKDATVPRMVFSYSDTRILDISSVNLKGFTISYSNIESRQTSDFYIANDFNKKNWTVEEVIGLFFDGELEQHLKLRTIPEPTDNHSVNEKSRKTPNEVEFSFKSRNHFAMLGASPFIYLALWTLLIYILNTTNSKVPVFLQICSAVIWLPHFILHFMHFFKNRGARVIVDKSNHELIYKKGDKSLLFDRDSIFRAQVTTGVSDRYGNWGNYSYVWFILNDRTYVVITNYIADPYEIVNALNCKYEEKQTRGPFLPLL